MSDVAEVIEEALRAHLAENGDGDFLTDWVVMLAAVAGEGAGECSGHTHYITICSHSPLHTIEGLIGRGTRILSDPELSG